MSLAHNIIALSTPPGTSALAVIRLSGDDVLTISKKYLGVANPTPRKMILKPFRAQDQSIIDEVLFSYFPAPHSFTGEPCLELFPHGNRLIVDAILREVVANPSFRLAEAGEFTKRAFENGKVDLVQAEAIGDLIHANTKVALKNAQKLMTGALSNHIHKLIADVKFLSAKMELEVDFAEEEEDAELAGWKLDVSDLRAQIALMHKGYKKSIRMHQTPRVVFFGKPNAGKSSLINALLEEERLLVSAQAGTTRDYIETRLHLSVGEVVLVDTAGLGEAVDELDAKSQVKTQDVLAQATLKIELCDGCLPDDETPPEDVIRIWTKADHPQFMAQGGIQVSVKDKDSLHSLQNFFAERLFVKQTEEEVWMSSARQADALLKADSQLLILEEALEQGHGPEVLAFELQQVRLELLSITGEISADDILHQVFAGFCIGK